MTQESIQEVINYLKDKFGLKNEEFECGRYRLDLGKDTAAAQIIYHSALIQCNLYMFYNDVSVAIENRVKLSNNRLETFNTLLIDVTLMEEGFDHG